MSRKDMLWRLIQPDQRSTSLMSAALVVLPLLAVSGGTGSVPASVHAGTQQNTPEALGPAWPPAVSRTGSASINVDGTLPRSPQPPALFTANPAGGGGIPTSGALGIPKSALQAYHQAAELLADQRPGCGIDWALLASIGRIESNHARGGYVDADGNTREPILGPVLDGTGNVAGISDTDGGRWDGSSRWDRAVGPMQFIPSTWHSYGADANGDGVADPNNIYDATVAAGDYLCANGTDLSDPQQLSAAVFRYNQSASYVSEVLTWAKAYRDGVLPVADSEVPLAVPMPAPTAPAPAPVSLPPLPSTDAPPTEPDGSGQPGSGGATSGSETSGSTGPGSTGPGSTGPGSTSGSSTSDSPTSDPTTPPSESSGSSTSSSPPESTSTTCPPSTTTSTTTSTPAETTSSTAAPTGCQS